jgi:hypothetical protein
MQFGCSVGTNSFLIAAQTNYNIKSNIILNGHTITRDVNSQIVQNMVISNSSDYIPFNIPNVFTNGCDIQLQAKTLGTGATASITVLLGGILIPNNVNTTVPGG